MLPARVRHNICYGEQTAVKLQQFLIKLFRFCANSTQTHADTTKGLLTQRTCTHVHVRTLPYTCVYVRVRSYRSRKFLRERSHTHRLHTSTHVVLRSNRRSSVRLERTFAYFCCMTTHEYTRARTHVLILPTANGCVLCTAEY